MSLALKATGLAVGYGVKPVLSGIDLDLVAGKVVCIVGPNGSGKSTLLRTLTKELTPMGGTIDLDGRPLSTYGFRELAQQIAYVPQSEAHFFDFTVRQVVAMGRLARSTGLWDTAEDDEAADQAMRRAGCSKLADRNITRLSGGETQLTLIARALAQGARILLLDEPTAHLDYPRQGSFVRLVRELAADGYALLLAVHDLNLCSSVADEVLVCSEGRIGLKAPSADALNSPELDRLYGVEFDRVQTDFGLRLHPRI